MSLRVSWQWAAGDVTLPTLPVSAIIESRYTKEDRPGQVPMQLCYFNQLSYAESSGAS